MEIKQPKTFNEQLQLVKDKGFLVAQEDEAECIEFLKRANYYRLSAYFLPFKRSDDTFIQGVPFLRIRRIYEFDSKIRAIVFEAIEDVEFYLRTQLAYYHAHCYGSLGYLDNNNFSQKHNEQKFTEKINECVMENIKTPVVKHHKEKYDSKFPIWVIVEFFSIGMLSYFYKDMRTKDRKHIAKMLYNTGSEQLESWLRCITDLRNRCAHYSRIYYWIFSAMPKMPKDCLYKANRKLFTQLLVVKFLYPSHKEWNKKVIPAIRAVMEEYDDDISLTHIGFPNDWETQLQF